MPVQRTDAPLHLFFSVGEPSGDLHGANLIKSLRRRDARVRCVGFGGSRMREAGCELHFELTQLAIMWIARVIWNLPKFVGLLRQADRYFSEQHLDGVILIDYPGFNWWIARRAKKHGIPVFYYGTPQMWAWAGWRVKKLRRLTDHVLCKLPFEPKWFLRRDCKATYVGHPYFDELSSRRLDLDKVARARTSDRLVTLLPGSRDQEVETHLPIFLRAAEAIRSQVPDVGFAIASFNEPQAAVARGMAAAHPALPLQIYTGATAELIEVADCCLACSGSVSLELLYHAKPSVIAYRIGRLANWAQDKFRTVKFITLANLIDGQEIYCRRGTSRRYKPEAEHALMPEFLGSDDMSFEIAQPIIGWLRNESTRSDVVQRLKELGDRHAVAGASERAADYILDALGSDHSCYDPGLASCSQQKRFSDASA